MCAETSELVIHDLAHALHYCFHTVKEKSPQASAPEFADAWVDFVVEALDGVCISRVAGMDQLSRPLPFAGTHRIEVQAFYAARSGMRGGGNIDVLFQLWCDTEDRWSTYGTPIVFQGADDFEPLADQVWHDLKRKCARVTLATPCGRVMFVLGADYFDAIPREHQVGYPDWFRVSDMASLAGSRTSPTPRNGRGLMDFSVDLASGWIGDPALSGASENPVMDELLTNFHVAHILRLKVVRDDSPANWKPPPRVT